MTPCQAGIPSENGMNRYFHIPFIVAMLALDIEGRGHPGRLRASMRLLESLGKRSKGRKYG